jgi:ligand-binding sensor domain-containing protein
LSVLQQKQGLTSNRINGIVQDQEGFVWIATNNGLNRFDGYVNKQYTKQQDDTTSLSNNSVLALYCDSANQLWILTINYLHRYKISIFFCTAFSSKATSCYMKWSVGYLNSLPQFPFQKFRRHKLFQIT